MTPSEVQLHSHLHHPLRERVVFYARAWAPNSNDGSGAQSEISVVSRVEHFPPELHPHLLRDGEGSMYAMSHVKRRGPTIVKNMTARLESGRLERNNR